MQNLPRRERLRGHGRIGEIFATGGKAVNRLVVVRASPADDGLRRVAAVAGKKLGGAVLRNRLKRRIRAAYRLLKDSLPRGCDLVIAARPGLAEAEWQDVLEQVEAAVTKAARSAAGPHPTRPRPSVSGDGRSPGSSSAPSSSTSVP